MTYEENDCCGCGDACVRSLRRKEADSRRLGYGRPCGTNWAGAGERWKKKTGCDDVIGALVPYCRKNISSAHLMGFLMAPWTNLSERGENYDRQMKAIDLFAEALA